MEYRRMDKLDIETSLLGFGCMRFPTTAGGKISKARATKMIDTAMEAGVNYYDTAYPYHDGESESFMGEVLQKYERGTYYLATKLRTDYIDFYLLHSLDAGRFHKMCELGIVTWLEEQQKAGKIRYFGFSFHDNYEAFEEIIRYRAWDFCQIQLNYMDTEEQAGIKGYKLAEELDIPMVVMEPVRGGSLAYMEDSIGRHLKELSKNATYASWALRWVGSLPNVKVILSGMSTMEQVHDNLYTFSPFMPLKPNEQIAILKVSTERKKRIKNGCTGCGYCMPCPKGVNIPANFRIWNDYGIYENIGALKWGWSNDVTEAEKPANCVECGLCEKACPQKLTIRADLKQLQQELDAAVMEIKTEDETQKETTE